MAKKKRSNKRSYTRSAATPAPRRRRSNGMKGVAKIPKLTTTAGILAANAEPLIWAGKMSISNPRATINYAKAAGKKMIEPESLANTAKAALIGYVAGYAVKKFAPKMVKKPMAKFASKVM